MIDELDEQTRPGVGTTMEAELLRSNARLHVLAQVSHAFAMVATDYRLLLVEIARTVADLVGDGCLVTLIDGDGETLVNAANAHRDPNLDAAYHAYLAGMGVSKLTSATVSAAVARTGMPQLMPEIDPATLVAQTDVALKPLVERLNVHSFAVVPIRGGQQVIGTLSLVRSGPGRPYGAEDLTLLQDLADRAGLAIENARLYDELERRVRQRTAELQSANHELEAFSYSVAHDLRAPLRWIDGYALALIEDHAVALDEGGREMLDRIRAAAGRMSTLVDDLLSLGRISRAPLQRRPVDLSAIVGRIVEELRQREPGRRVTVSVPPGLEAQADVALLTIALENLLGNAWKFTGKRPEARIEVGRGATSRGLAFYVRDDGPGFDMAHTANLFQPFHRLHGEGEFAGTGIGLATVQRIVARHGGEIWPEATPGQGATFYFTLGG